MDIFWILDPDDNRCGSATLTLKVGEKVYTKYPVIYTFNQNHRRWFGTELSVPTQKRCEY